uniref:Uncharacterized protein n=1 Tax=Roseihalotalea indica TaxID=2867963 RepID=A0AA49GTV3_9BACT|nr:hypothetical protein K4G66_08755 [Tunicatimonas sp. TK19036]
MKTITHFFVALFTLTTVSAFAQNYYPAEQQVQFDKTTANAWVVTVDNEPLDELKDGWSDYVKQELDVKSKKDGRDALIAKEVTVPRIAENIGDLRAKFFNEGDQSKMAVAFTTGYSIALNTTDNPDEAENLRRLVKNFVKYYKTDKLNEQIAQNEKREKALESSYEKNEREHKKLTKHIEKVEKQMNSGKTDENKKFDLKNQKIADESRIVALDEIMMNQKHELTDINQSIQKYRADISHLETLFTEPLAKKEANEEINK